MSKPIRLRASSIAELLDCPMRWEQKHLLGKRLPSTPPAMIGTAVHGSTAAYDKSRMEGTGLSIDDAAQVAEDLINNPMEEVDWLGVKQSKAIEIAMRVHNAYCREISPSLKFTVVEHTFKPLSIQMPSGVVFEITGTCDRIAVDSVGRTGPADVKTGVAAVSADGQVIIGKHTPQLGAYTLLAEEEFGPMLLPASIIGLQTSSAARVGFGWVRGSREALIGTDTRPGILHYVEQYFVSGLFPPNPGSHLCSDRYCPYFEHCSFHG